MVEIKLFPTPVGLRIVAFESQLFDVGAVGEHGPYLVGAGAVDWKTMWRPSATSREVVATGVVGELDPLLAGDVHKIKIVGAGSPGRTYASRKRSGTGHWATSWRDGVALIGEALEVGAIRFHGIDLGRPERPLTKAIWIRFCGSRWERRQALIVGEAAGVSPEPSMTKMLDSHCGGREGDLAIGRPGGREIHAAKTREGDHAIEIERVHHDLPTAFVDRTEGEAGAIGEMRARGKCCRGE